MWAEDVDGYVSQFADDAELKQSSVHGGATRVLTGREAIRTFIEGSWESLKPKPLTHDHVVTVISETEAIGSSYVQVLDGSNSYSDMLISRYDDQYVLQDGAWKFRERHANILKINDSLQRQLSQ
jgi:hypothetical protein